MSKVSEGINIWSGSAGLGAALTNPTCLARRKGTLQQDYPVSFRGRTYADAEGAYHANSRDLPFEEKQKVCALVVAAKLTQHPGLTEAIRARGGVAWLSKCSHFTGAKTESFRAWEGRGRESAYLRALITAYEAVSEGKTLPDEKPPQAQGSLF